MRCGLYANVRNRTANSDIGQLVRLRRLLVVTTESYLDSLYWSLLHYGQWLLLTPFIWFALARMQLKDRRQRAGAYLLLICASVLCALVYQRLVIGGLSRPDWATAVLLHGPEQLKLCLIVMLGWFLLPRSVGSADAVHSAPAAVAATSGAPVRPLQGAVDDLVLVLTGQGETLIRWRDVEFLSAAANYVELTCGDASYLLRATMRQTETMLPAGEFIRVHRSHIVRITAIAQIRLQASGNAIVQLRRGGSLPLSKSYRQQLRGYRPDLLCTAPDRPA